MGLDTYIRIGAHIHISNRTSISPLNEILQHDFLFLHDFILHPTRPFRLRCFCTTERTRCVRTTHLVPWRRHSVGSWKNISCRLVSAIHQCNEDSILTIAPLIGTSQTLPPRLPTNLERSYLPIKAIWTLVRVSSSSTSTDWHILLQLTHWQRISTSCLVGMRLRSPPIPCPVRSTQSSVSLPVLVSPSDSLKFCVQYLAILGTFHRISRSRRTEKALNDCNMI